MLKKLPKLENNPILIPTSLLKSFHLLNLFFYSNVLELPDVAKNIASDNGFEIKGYRFTARMEHITKPRIVRVGAIQNSIVLPTTNPVDKQREAIWEKIRVIIQAAAAAEVNIVCMQEAWSKYNIFK